MYRACLEYYDFCCTLKRLNSLRIESRDMAKLVKISWLKLQGLSLSVDRELEVPQGLPCTAPVSLSVYRQVGAHLWH